MQSNRWSVLFYSDAQGNEPVKDFAVALNYEQRRKVIRAFQLLQEFGTALREPNVKHVAGDLWELRVQESGNAFRIIYFLWRDRQFVLLHALTKKTMRLRPEDVETARRRRDDWMERKMQDEIKLKEDEGDYS